MFTTIEDLIASAVAQKPGEFEEAFNALIIERAANAINNKKAEIAQTMFNPVEEEVISEDEEEIEEGNSTAGIQGQRGTQSGPAQSNLGTGYDPKTNLTNFGPGKNIYGQPGSQSSRGVSSSTQGVGQGQSGASFEGGKAPGKKKK